MITARRSNIKLGGGRSTVITIPKLMVKGQYSTMAGGRLLLVDPQGRIPEAALAKLLEHIEPLAWQAAQEHEEA